MTSNRKRKKSSSYQGEKEDELKKECLLNAMDVMDIEIMEHDDIDHNNMNLQFSKDVVNSVHGESKYDTSGLHKKYYDLSHNIIQEHIKKIQDEMEKEEEIHYETNKKLQHIQTTPLLNFSEKTFKSLSDDDIEFHLDDDVDHNNNHK